MRWKDWLKSWWFAAFTLVVGAPGRVDDVRAWARILGVDVLTTVALMGLTAHVVAVGFSDWEPYRGWWNRIARSGNIAVRYRSDGDDWSTLKVSRRPGLLHRIPLEDDGRASIIEINSRWAVRFVSMQNWEHFWFEDEAETEGFRRYVCRHIPIGHGYREATFTVEASPADTPSPDHP